MKENEKKYSYQDCWNYAFDLQRNNENNVDEIKNDLIILCQTIPENFWSNFGAKLLTFSDYSRICYNLDKYLNESFPVPYLVNKVYFHGLSFYIEEGVFIPQRDTEILVEKTQQLAKKFWGLKSRLRVLDIGTGCGNITISLARNNPNWNFTAIDINEKALKVAKINAIKQKVKNIRFQRKSLFEGIISKENFDIIVANPPYISNDEYQCLSSITKKQPREALVAENDGYCFYQEIFQQVQSSLVNKFFKFLLMIEIGYQQEEKIIKLIIEYFSQVKVSIFFDYHSHSRIIAIYRL